MVDRRRKTKKWGKYRQGGTSTTIECTFCGRKTPKFKALPVQKGFSIGKIPGIDRHQFHASRVKSYACISCAKHRHIIK